jgi:hypothetical protein
MLAPNLLPKAVPHDGSRLLLGFIVRPDRGLVEDQPLLGHTPPRPSRSPERAGGPDAGFSAAQWPRLRSERDFWRFAWAHLRPYFPMFCAPRDSSKQAHPSPGARAARVAARLGPRARRAFGRLPRDGHHPHPGYREGEGFSQGALLGAGILRAQRLQDLVVGLRLQGGFDRGPRGRNQRFRAGWGGLRREAHSRRPPGF